jgi:hypothetical protein
MQSLPTEITHLIASRAQEVWYQISQYDPAFRQYAYSNAGRKEFLQLFTRAEKDNEKTQYKIFGILHRDNDLPAAIWADGTQHWYKNGQKHRDNDLPAEIWDDGTQHWYKNGQLHRDNDLPAVIWADGTQRWYKNGQQYTP